MITKHEYTKIRRLYFGDNLTISDIARKTSLSRNTVKKWLRAPYSTPPKYCRKPSETKIKPFETWLLKALESDMSLPIRERRNAKMLFDVILQNGFTGDYSRVTEFIHNWRTNGGGVAVAQAPSEDKERWMRWLYSIEQPHRLPSNSEATAGLKKIYEVLAPSPNSPRTRALVILAKIEGFSIRHIARHLAISSNAVRGYLADFQVGGENELFKRVSKPRKSDNPELKNAIFALLHEPPSLHGFNRTTWRMDDLTIALNQSGHLACKETIRKTIKAAGYRWRSAKVVLTSNDPEYREKYQHIQDILSSLKENERFFSIDEFGPFAVKAKAGRNLVPPEVYPSVQQWQKSKGWLILTAALELSRNQVTHFYSKAKNTAEMIRMIDELVKLYTDARKLYISWDAASWHLSKELKKHIAAHNEVAEINKLPFVEMAPLPASAQFLNLIESVFSGMARAIIHNSDYASTKAAMDAIDRYFKDRNQHFIDNPKRAGKKIWGMERSICEFSASNNCKDPAYMHDWK